MGVRVGAFEVLVRDHHFDPGVSGPHPEELGLQLSNFVTENYRHTISTQLYLVFIMTGTTPLC